MKKEIVYLMSIFLLSAGSSASFLLLLPFLTKDLHLSITQAGIIGGAFAFSRIFASVPLTLLAKRLGSLQVLFLAMIVFGLGFLFVGFSHMFSTFIIIFLFTGMSFSVFQPLIFGLATRLTEKENRGKVMGFVTSGSDLGRIAIAGAISFIATQMGWRTASIVAACITGIFLFIAYIKKPTVDYQQKENTGSFLTSSKGLIKNERFLLSSGVVFFDTIASASLFVFLPFLMFYRHIPLTLMPVLIIVFFAGSLVGKLYLGKLVDTFQNTVVFIVGESLMALCLITIANVTSPILFAFFSFILGLLTKGTVPASLTMASESVAEAGNFEHAYAFNYVLLSIGNTIAPILIGVVADHFSIVFSFYVCAVSAIVALVPAFLFHSKRKMSQLAEEMA